MENERPVPDDAPAWNCVSFPGEGMHCLDGHGGCRWCGRTRDEIAHEREKEGR